MAQIFLFHGDLRDQGLLKPWLEGELLRLKELNHKVRTFDYQNLRLVRLPEMILRERPEFFYFPLAKAMPSRLINGITALARALDVKMVVGGVGIETFFSLDGSQIAQHAVQLAVPKIKSTRNSTAVDWLIVNELSSELWSYVSDLYLSMYRRKSSDNGPRVVYLPGLTNLDHPARHAFIRDRLAHNSGIKLAINEDMSLDHLVRLFFSTANFYFDPSYPLNQTQQLLLTLALSHKKQIYPPRLFLQNENIVDRIYFEAFSN